MIPARVHLKLTVYPAPGLWMRLFIAAVLLICTGGCLSGTAAVMLNVSEYAAYIAILAMFAAFVTAVFLIRRLTRRRLELLVLHTAYGANLYARCKRTNGTLYAEWFWETLKSVKYDYPNPAQHAIKYPYQVLLRIDGNGEEQVVIDPGEKAFGDFDLTDPIMKKLAAEINHQQDGTWKKDPQTLVDDDAEMEIEPGWDEKAPPPVDPLHPDSISR